MALFARVRTALLEAERKTEAQLTTDARTMAIQSGWSQSAAANLEAYVAGGKVAVTFYGAEDYELGTEDQPPLSVARRIENRSEADVSRLFESNLSAALGGLL